MPMTPSSPDLLRKTIPEIFREIRAIRALLNRVFAGTTPSGADLVLTGGLTADHATVGQAGGGGSGLVLGAAGTLLKQIQAYSVSITPTSVPLNSTAFQTTSVLGLSTSDKVFINGPQPAAGCFPVHARVSAVNTLEITFVNVTAGALVPAAGTYLVLAIRS